MDKLALQIQPLFVGNRDFWDWRVHNWLMSSGCDLAGCKITAALLSKPTMGNCLPK
jgi:hypothetical protein